MSDLVGNSEDRFSHNEAHMQTEKNSSGLRPPQTHLSCLLLYIKIPAKFPRHCLNVHPSTRKSVWIQERQRNDRHDLDSKYTVTGFWFCWYQFLVSAYFYFLREMPRTNRDPLYMTFVDTTEAFASFGK